MPSSVSEKAPLIIVAGPTAVGKTKAALELAVKLEAEIISADSVQVYKGLDIGSAKPGPEELGLVRHHLIDVLEPWESMDAGRFVDMADQVIASMGKKPVVVAGGTGLYIKALLFGLAPLPPVDEQARARLNRQLQAEGLAWLRARLEEVDPVYAARIHPADKQRNLRALEVFQQTGRPFSDFQNQHLKEPRYSYLLWGLNRPRPELRELIALRSRQMWENGLLREVEALLASGVAADAPALRTIGYRQAVAVLHKRMSREEALVQMIQQTNAYAKRQVTWFKAMPGINWINDGFDLYAPSLRFVNGER